MKNLKLIFATLISLFSINVIAQNCGCLSEIDASFNIAEFTNGTPPEYRNDDGSTNAKILPFNFCLNGTIYDSVYINNNGNITFNNPYLPVSAVGFPSASYVMIAPFWADVDTRSPASGLVYYKITSTYMIVQWKQVGYFDHHSDKLNTFQVIISDGNDPILPPGINVAFCYGDMHWTTGDANQGANGFGGIAATTGVNTGDGVNYTQMGRFDQQGNLYDGGNGNNDGIDFLKKQSLYLNSCTNSNIPPVVSGFNYCDTVKICGLLDTLCFDESFFSVESGQITNVYVNLNGFPGALVTSNTSGNTAVVSICVYPSLTNLGLNVVSFVAADNGTPAGTTFVNVFIMVDSAAPPPNPVITGFNNFCFGDSTVLSVSPSIYSNYLWNNGITNDTIIVTSSGNYSLTASLNGCDVSASLNVTETPLPTPSIAGNLFTCPASPSTLLFTDSLIYPLYNWSNGIQTIGQNDSIIVGNGNYSLTVTDMNGCTSLPTYASVITDSVTTSVIGSLISTLNAGTSYQWIDCNNANLPISGETTPNLYVNNTGSYAVIVTNGPCIDTSVCINVNCGAYYTTSYDSIQNNFTLVVDTATALLAIAYHWDFGDGTSSSLPSPNHTYAQDTLYNVCMKIYTPTGDSCQYCHVIGIDSLGNEVRNGFTLNVQNSSSLFIPNLLKETKITIAPNPFTSQTTITFSEEQKNSTLKIMDILGKEIKKMYINGKQAIIEKGEMKAGIYFVEITSAGSAIARKKIIIQ